MNRKENALIWAGSIMLSVIGVAPLVAVMLWAAWPFLF